MRFARYSLVYSLTIVFFGVMLGLKAGNSDGVVVGLLVGNFGGKIVGLFVGKICKKVRRKICSRIST